MTLLTPVQYIEVYTKKWKGGITCEMKLWFVLPIQHNNLSNNQQQQNVQKSFMICGASSTFSAVLGIFLVFLLADVETEEL